MGSDDGGRGYGCVSVCLDDLMCSRGEILVRCVVVAGYVFFFFQAEDGIRDIGVTGVQTCALPIAPRWLVRSWPWSDVPEDAEAYAAAGVSIAGSDRAVAAIVGALGSIEVPKRTVDLPGHYASVLKVSDDLGIAFATDGVGSKLVVAERTGRLDTVGIDCVAMNVNDIICIGAEPLALLDYLAVEDRKSVV